LDPHKPEVSPVVPRDKSAVEDVVAPTLNAAMGEFGEEEYLPEETEGEPQAPLLSRE